MSEQSHEMDKISFTANDIAVRRTVMDLPYAQDICDILMERARGTDDEKQFNEALEPSNARLIPFFEARYRLLDELCRGTGTKNVLELAAGLAPRGLTWTEDPEIQYVELDLPKKSAEKQEIIQELERRSKIQHRPNLHLEKGDVLNFNDLHKAVKHFKNSGPVVIAHEGLLRYLTHDRKSILASHIWTILEQFGGWWITSDINLPDPLLTKDPKISAYVDKHQQRIGDVSANLFPSIQAAREFFEELGFSIEQYSFTKVTNRLVSPQKFQMSSEEVGQIIGWRVAFVMKIN